MKPGLLMLPSAVSDSRVHNILPNKIETDFQFSRASSATRVNHQGLIENVGYFSDELVRNGDFSELGPEIIINGDFATDSDWTLGTGWTISNGKLRADNVSLINTFQAYVYTSGKTYKVTYTISDYVKGEVRFQLGGGGGTVNGTARDANGTYTEYIVATNNHTSARFRALSADGGFTGNIDNVSVKQVDPNNYWTLGGNAWSITDKLIADGTQTTGTNSYQSQTFDNGKTYKVVFTCTIQAGNLDVRLQGGGSTVTGTNRTTSGTYTQLLTSTGNTSLRFRGDSNFIGSISSVSAVEVIGDKPRLDYDPTNPTCPHLLLEPQSTNLITFSNDYTQTFWVKQQSGIASAPVVTSNYAISPDGTRNADRVVFDLNGATNSDFSQLATSLTTSVGNITNSVYIKSNTDSNYVMNFTKASGANEIITVTNEWQRFEATINNTSTSSAFRIRLRHTESTSNYADVSIYGAQLEQQAYATSLIPTAGAAETRVAETCTNAGNVDTFNSTEGVLYCEIAALADSSDYRFIAVSDGTNTNRVTIYFKNNNTLVSFVPGISEFNSNANILNFNKAAIQYKSGDYSFWVNGSVAETSSSTSGTHANLNELKFSMGSDSNDFYGKVKGLATYNRALTNTELYTITSTQYSAYSGMVAALGNYTIPC